jgi:hypothetical protein
MRSHSESSMPWQVRLRKAGTLRSRSGWKKAAAREKEWDGGVIITIKQKP